MIPLEPGAIDRLLSGENVSHRSVALRHASIHGRPELRGDDPSHPSSAAWVREGDGGCLEAFAAGEPGPVLDWLRARARGRPVALLAPPSWEAAIRAQSFEVKFGIIQTRRYRGASPWLRSTVEVRRLTLADSHGFEVASPAWALRSWGDFASLIDRGAAFGVPTPSGFASVAWTYESDLEFEKLGVATLPRYRRLGLGRVVAGVLIDLIVRNRLGQPLWVAAAENNASATLASSLGFADPTDETLLRWTPRRG